MELDTLIHYLTEQDEHTWFAPEPAFIEADGLLYSSSDLVSEVKRRIIHRGWGIRVIEYEGSTSVVICKGPVYDFVLGSRTEHSEVMAYVRAYIDALKMERMLKIKNAQPNNAQD